MRSGKICLGRKKALVRILKDEYLLREGALSFVSVNETNGKKHSIIVHNYEKNIATMKRSES